MAWRARPSAPMEKRTSAQPPAWPLNLLLSPPFFRSGAKVTLFEKELSFGGHTLTDDSLGFPVDLGFQVRRMR